jgi:hypothetical protein
LPYKLNVAVTQATDLAVSSGYIRKHTYPAWFSGKLKAYIENKNYSIGVTRNIRLTFL